ncbi:MAG: sporulation protein YqfD [Clostridia bacterium]|nr:sporulation protein YqfD [Clostridia bacterium]
MIRPDLFICGYRRFLIDEEDVLYAARLFLSRGVSVRFKNNSFVVGERKSREIEELLGTRVKFKKSKMLGIGGFLYEWRGRVGIFLALIITASLLLLSGDLVWDVRVEGCEDVEEEIVAELSECGFSVGTRWSKTDLSKVEVTLLSLSEHVSWININRRGTVAYVKVADKNTSPPDEQKQGYSNVVAECDAVIEEISVRSGVAMVKRGDVVRAGQVLISGILPAELGSGFCYAEGSVIGRVSEDISVIVSANEELKINAERKISSVRFNFFGFSVNIFKSYRNFGKEYVIIEKNKPLTILGKTLPVSLCVKYKQLYRVTVTELSKDELVEAAAARTARAVEEALGEGTLVRLRTDGGFENNEYKMNTHLVYTKQIGRDAPFEVK